MSFSDIFKSSFLENVAAVTLTDMILALVLPLFPAPAARAEEENTRTTYDEGATYTIDFEPEAPAAAESADEGLVIGDLPLTAQREFLKALDAERLIGVHLNEACVMTPSKSVTAVIGLKERKKA